MYLIPKRIKREQEIGIGKITVIQLFIGAGSLVVPYIFSSFLHPLLFFPFMAFCFLTALYLIVRSSKNQTFAKYQELFFYLNRSKKSHSSMYVIDFKEANQIVKQKREKADKRDI